MKGIMPLFAPQCLRDLKYSGEPLDHNGKMFVWLLCDAWSITKWLLGKIAAFSGAGRAAESLDLLEIVDDETLNNYLRRKYEYAREVSQKWQDLGIDAMVMPAYPHCTFKAVDNQDASTINHYFLIWNIVNFPAGIVPVT